MGGGKGGGERAGRKTTATRQPHTFTLRALTSTALRRSLTAVGLLAVDAACRRLSPVTGFRHCLKSSADHRLSVCTTRHRGYSEAHTHLPTPSPSPAATAGGGTRRSAAATTPHTHAGGGAGRQRPPSNGRHARGPARGACRAAGESLRRCGAATRRRKERCTAAKAAPWPHRR